MPSRRTFTKEGEEKKGKQEESEADQGSKDSMDQDHLRFSFPGYGALFNFSIA